MQKFSLEASEDISITADNDYTETVNNSKKAVVANNFDINIFGKMIEYVEGDKKSEVGSDLQQVAKKDIAIESEGMQEHHAQREISNNSGEHNQLF